MFKSTIDLNRVAIVEAYEAACSADPGVAAAPSFDPDLLLVAIADSSDVIWDIKTGPDPELRRAAVALADASPSLSVAGLRLMYLAQEIWGQAERVASLVDVTAAKGLDQSLTWAMHMSATRKLGISDQLAHSDELTALLNRRAFGRDIASQSAPVPLGLLAFVDLDGFKKVNDTLGHDGGDELLKRMAAFLISGFSVDAQIYRWGGDEFLLWFRGQSADDVRARMGAARLAAPTPFTFGLSEIVGSDARETVEFADLQMLELKRKKKQISARLGRAVVRARRALG